MIEEIDTATGSSSKLKFSSLLILGTIIFILSMFALFGTNSSMSLYTGSVTGANSAINEIQEDDIIKETPSSSTLSEEGKYKLILNVLKLKSLDKKITRLQFAESVSNIADYIEALNNKKITDVWFSMFSCLEEGCNERYYELLEVILDNAFIIRESDESFIKTLFAGEPKYPFMPELLSNVVNLQKAVNKVDVIETSKAMIAVNSLIFKVDSAEINDLWNELVNCDLECPYYDNLLIKLIEFKINSLKE